MRTRLPNSKSAVWVRGGDSLRTADGGREATTGNASAVRRLAGRGTGSNTGLSPGRTIANTVIWCCSFKSFISVFYCILHYFGAW